MIKNKTIEMLWYTYKENGSVKREDLNIITKECRIDFYQKKLSKKHNQEIFISYKKIT